MKKQIHLNESELRRLVKESVQRVLRESAEGSNYTEGAMVRNYTPNMWQVTSKYCTFYVDSQGKFYDENGKPTNVAQHCLCDNDATNIAYELNHTIGNMFHWDMFRRKR